MKRIRLAALLAAFAPILVTVGEPDSAATAAPAPVVILKFDDLTQKGADKAKGEAVSSNFEAVADIVRRLGVNASFGIICNSLESGTPEYFDWIRARRDEGIFEFWCHGLTHAEYGQKNGRRHCEFSQTTQEEQTTSLRRCQDLAREKLGFEFSCLGAPFNQTDATTARVLDESFPEITSCFFSPAKTTATRRCLERRLDLEVPIFKPNAENLQKEYDAWAKDLQYIVLQGHPNGWGGKQRIEFEKCVRFLKERGCRFMTPSEFLAEPLRATSLPWPPKKESASPKASKPSAPKGPVPNPPAGEPPSGEPTDRQQFLANPTLADVDGDGRPDGWFRTTGEAQGVVDLLSDADGTRFVRLRVEKEGESVILQQFAELPPDADCVTVAARVRWSGIRRGAKPYMSGCVQAMFANAKGGKVGEFLPAANFLGDSAGEWRTISRTFRRPEGDARRLRVQFALYSVGAGTLDAAWATAAVGNAGALPTREQGTGNREQGTGNGEGGMGNGETRNPNSESRNGNTAYPVSLLGDDPLAALRPQGNTNLFEVTRLTGKGKPGTENQEPGTGNQEPGTENQDKVPRLRISVRRGARAVWDAQLRAKCTAPVRKGDVLSLSYCARGVRTDSEIAEVTFLNAVQLDRAPWTKVFEERPVFPIPEGWMLHQSVHVSPESFKAGEYVFNIQFGGIDPEEFEIADLAFVNHGPDVDPASLPRTPPRRYTGHEPDAPWRAEALARIERIRKADLDIVVLDADGRPVPDAEIRVEMTLHAFGWGSAVYGWTWAADNDDARRYREEFLRHFNLLVPENGLKWPSWDDPKTRANTLRMIDWARENGCEVRGHTLVWPSFKRNSDAVRLLADNPAALRAAISNHIAEVAGATCGKIRAWDVVNEPTTNFDFMRLLGDDVIAEWFRLAREADPAAQLFLNENQILAGTKLQSLEYWLDRIVENGGPLGGIGIQGHLGYGTAAPERMLEIFTRLHDKYKVPLSITELDVNTKNEEDQAAYLRDVLIAAFSHPAVDSVTFWGFWNGRHWLKTCPLFREDWSRKPGLEVYEKLVMGDWWTRETVRTGPDGHARLRGFLGDYTLSASVPGGDTASQNVKLAIGGVSTEIRLVHGK